MKERNFEHLKKEIVRQTEFINKLYKADKLTSKQYDSFYGFMQEVNSAYQKTQRHISELELINWDLTRKEDILSKFMIWFFCFNQLRKGNEKFIKIIEQIDKKLLTLIENKDWEMPKGYYEKIKTIFNVARKNK